jgi:hypothetical protein
MSVTLGNPIIVTSGTTGAEIEAKMYVDRIYWHQPSLGGNRTANITKGTSGGPTLLVMTVEVSGQSQVMELNRWWNRPYINTVDTGTLYIHTR